MFIGFSGRKDKKINPTSLTEWQIHIVHSDSASNRGNLKVLQRIAPLQVVIDALFIFENPKNFSMRTVWRNTQNSKTSFRWMPPGSRRNINWNLFTAILILLSQALRNATGHLSAICCWCVFLWSKTSQNRPSHPRLNLKIFAVPYLS